MICPGCESPMVEQAFAGNYGTTVLLDLCHHCNGIWFDGKESLALTPGSVLQLFRAMHEKKDGATGVLREAMECLRCGSPLRQAHDQQRSTKFTYQRCPEDCGRFITFFQFLREKNIVKDLSPKELIELKARVKVVPCSNCGAPVHLSQRSACEYCLAPISVIDPSCVAQTLKQLQQSEQKRSTVDPAAAAKVVMAQLQAQQFYSRLDAAERSSFGTRPGGGWGGLVGAGLGILFSALD